MIDLIVYFVFSAIFIVGMLAYNKDDISLDELIIGTLLGWLFLPFVLGILVSKHIKDNERTNRTV